LLRNFLCPCIETPHDAIFITLLRPFCRTRLAEHARDKAEKLDSQWRKQELEMKKESLLQQMKRNQREMAQIDNIERSLSDPGVHQSAAADAHPTVGQTPPL
jgi:hypothetical protein